MRNFKQKSLTSSFTKRKFFGISHLITLFGVIFSLFGSEINQNLIAGIGILSFGILHGANDLKIIAKSRVKTKSKNSFNYLALYITIVFLGIVIFYFIPGIALLSFVVVSCYHFGEQHWEERLKFNKWDSLYYFTYGALIFLMLFTFHYEDTTEIISLILIRRIFGDIPKIELDVNWLENSANKQLIFDLFGVLIIYFLIYLFNKHRDKISKKELSDRLKRFVSSKKAVSLVLLPVLIFTSIYSIAFWISSLFSISIVGAELPDINAVFYNEFFYHSNPS
ncbi:Brp/Blh family beta-carotene 15,15'-dioxygenase [Flavobacteriaceae bacterium]|nr:Brp/Blh family beta-carotene 15,15'-dioxygenase [Flavobacteriaceae bacterium]